MLEAIEVWDYYYVITRALFLTGAVYGFTDKAELAVFDEVSEKRPCLLHGFSNNSSCVIQNPGRIL